jgi:hypothetical protein
VHNEIDNVILLQVPLNLVVALQMDFILRRQPKRIESKVMIQNAYMMILSVSLQKKPLVLKQHYLLSQQ